jgi:sodium/hydrogen exchanger 10/11
VKSFVALGLLQHVASSIGDEAGRVLDLEREIKALKMDIEIMSLAQRRLGEDGANNVANTSGILAHADGSGSGMSSRSSSSSSSSHDGEHGEHVHQQEALVYLVVVLIVGTSIMQLTTLPWLHSLPYTVVLFVLGVCCALLYHALGDNASSLGAFGRSYEMWMGIEPHLLMFVMLPVLLTGDAMTIDTAVAKRVACQCVYLAGPGVAAGALLTASFLYLYLQWDFTLCMAAGAILAATDPVAVVSLLKELGASPSLTIQIQGESLLNDGSAVVLFQVAYNMLKGEVYDVKGVIVFFIYMVVGSWFLGMVIGGVFSSWIRSASNRLDHHNGIIQLSLSLCCAYWSFIFAEGVLGLSGILSTVAAGVVLADSIWPKVVSKEAMHEVWHTLEYLGNTLLFFLAGALTGEAIFLVDPIDFVHLIVLYVVLLCVRALVIFGSRPILRWLSPDREPVPFADCLVMTWGGLRGAVGLALAIQVNSERALGNIEEDKAVRVLFFTGGIAALTLVINATTCPMLVNWLGITATCNARARVLLQIHRRLGQIGDKMNQRQDELEPMIDRVLDEVKHHIELECVDIGALLIQSKAQHFSDDICLQTTNDVASDCFKWWKLALTCKRFSLAKEAFEGTSFTTQELMGWDHAHPLLKQERSLCDLVELGRAEPDMVRAVNEAFIALVRNQYWTQIDRGEFVPGTNLAEILLNSATDAHIHANTRLADFRFVRKQFGLSSPISISDELRKGVSGFTSSSGSPSPGTDTQRSSKRKTSRGISQALHVNVGAVEVMTTQVLCKKLSETVQFNVVMMLIVVADTIRVISDPDYRRGYITTVFDTLFMTFFVVEMVVKLLGFRLTYFTNGWRVLDLMCIVLGLFEIVMGMIMDSSGLTSDDLKSEFLLIKLGRIFRVMRTLRVVVFVKYLRHLRAQSKGRMVSPELADRLERIVTLRSFVQAHLHSHHEFVRYFGRLSSAEKSPKYRSQAAGVADAGEFGIVTEPEQARCIIESWTMVYEAVVCGSKEIEQVNSEGPWILEGMCTLRDSMVIADSFLKFALSAVHAGVIHETDAECIIHPISNHLRNANTLLADIHSGILSFDVDDHRNASSSANKTHKAESIERTTDSTAASETEDASEDASEGQANFFASREQDLNANNFDNREFDSDVWSPDELGAISRSEKSNGIEEGDECQEKRKSDVMSDSCDKSQGDPFLRMVSPVSSVCMGI